MIADLKSICKGLIALDCDYEYKDDETPAILEINDPSGTPIVIEIDSDEESYNMYWAYSHQSFAYGEEDELITVLAGIVKGVVMSFGIFVGDDLEVAGYCEKDRVPDIVRDFKDDPMTLGGELRIRTFATAEKVSILLSECEL